MFKKFVTFAMVLSIFTVQASAATNDGLKAAYEELSVALAVTDPSDTATREAEMKKFTAAIREMKANGMTNADLVGFVKSEMKDERAARDFETAANMISLNMTTEEASKYMVKAMSNSGMKGASFNGEVLMYVGLGVLIVAAAVSLAAAGYTGGGRSCSNPSVYVCDTTCYNDYYGYSCYDDCYYSCY